MLVVTGTFFNDVFYNEPMCTRTYFSNYNHELFYFFRRVMEQLDSESDNVELDSPCLMLRYD